jgi:hypothetical protein
MTRAVLVRNVPPNPGLRIRRETVNSLNRAIRAVARTFVSVSGATGIAAGVVLDADARTCYDFRNGIHSPSAASGELPRGTQSDRRAFKMLGLVVASNLAAGVLAGIESGDDGQARWYPYALPIANSIA